MAGIGDERIQEVIWRLDHDPVAWLTTVRPSGQPDTVAVWFLWKGDRFVIYSRPGKAKLRNLASNPKVSVVLDDTKQGTDVVRSYGEARVVSDYPSLDELPAYVEKYEHRIRANGYANTAVFAANFSVAIVITPMKFWA